MLVILENHVSSIDYTPALEKQIYRMQDERLDDPKQWKKVRKYFKIFCENLEMAIESHQNILVMTYNPVIAYFLGDLIKFSRENNLVVWPVVTFFHSDKVSSQLIDNEGISLLETKTVFLSILEHFPFINKINIPLDYKLNSNYIYRLLKEIW